MRKNKFILFFMSLITFILLTSCERCEPRYEYFIVQVDSLYVPSLVSHNNTLYVYLYGFIGPDGCYSFSHFEAQRDSFELELTAWGKHDVKAIVCPLMVVYLDTIYQVYPLYPGLFFIEINQHDGSVLKDTVTVE